MISKRKAPKQGDVPAPDASDAVRPVVRLPKGGLSTGAVVGGAALAAIMLFSVLEGRRRTPSEPSISEEKTSSVP